MNSVDGAPNATILAEGASTTYSIAATSATTATTIKTTTSLCASKTTETSTTPVTTIQKLNVINSTVIVDATDEFHESDNNVQEDAVVDEPQPRQQRPQHDQHEQRNEAPIKGIIMKSETKTEAKTAPIQAEKTVAAATAKTMGNTNKTNKAMGDNDNAVEEEAAAAAATTTTTQPLTEPTKIKKINKNTKAETNADVPTTDMITPKSKCVGNEDAGTVTHTDNTTITKPQSQPQPKPTKTKVLAAEDDNCELNGMELCRCCGKPNVTLYDLFPKVSSNGVDNDNSLEVDDVTVNILTENMEMSMIDENQKITSNEGDTISEDITKNDAEIKQKTATAVDVSDSTKTNVTTKIDGTNTPKRCYRTIAASIAAAAAASGTNSTINKTTTGSCSDGAPTCEKINDPIVAADAATSGDDVVADRYGEGARIAATTSDGGGALRVKKSETNQNVTAPNNNADAMGQTGDNMENILQEMQIWQLRKIVKPRFLAKKLADFKNIHRILAA